MRSFVVICPGSAQTGGIELLHQLTDTINRAGHLAKICYHPFNKLHDQPLEYQTYNCPQIKFNDINLAYDYIVIPETYTHLITKFNPNRVIVWWLSVDNYVNSSKWMYAIRNKMLPWDYPKIHADNNLLKNVGRHLYQSEYAKLYLEKNFLKDLSALGDYINQDYLERSNTVDFLAKKNIVVYNPAKGFSQIKKIIRISKGQIFRPIKNMSRSEVAATLSEAKIYIDFGNHPGKDRIPREAAILGCCVVTNRVGSAANPVDIPTYDVYKIDDRSCNFESKTLGIIDRIFANYSTSIQDFSEYRQIIRQEKESFGKDVRHFIQQLPG